MSDQGDRNRNLDESRLARILRSAGRRPQPPEQMSQDVRLAVKEAWKAELARPKPGLSPALGRWLAMAASIALLVTVGLYRLSETDQVALATLARAVNQVESESNQGWQPVAGDTALSPGRLRTGANAYALINMTSGPAVRLSGETLITLQDNDRVLLEKGSIYIDSGGQRGLGVRTPFGLATDIGTQFLVSVDNERWHVQVREGEVVVADDDRTINANAGERILISADNRVEKQRVEPNDPSWSWIHNVSPVIDIKGMRLIDYLDLYARETGLEVKFDDEMTRRKAEEFILGGSIAGLQPAEALRAVLSSYELEYEQEGQIVLISDEE